MKIKSATIIFLLADSDVRSLNTTIVEGPIDRHKSRLASRETGDSLAHIVREAWTRPNRCRNGRESGVRVYAWGRLPDGTKSYAGRAFYSLTLSGNVIDI